MFVEGAHPDPGGAARLGILRTLSRPLLLVVLAATLALGFAHDRRLGADDDRLWLYQSATQIGRAEEGDRLEALVRASIPASAATRRWRFNARAAYSSNYIAASSVYWLAATVVRDRTDPLMAADYPAYLARAIYTGFLSAYVAACTVFVLILATGRDRRMLPAAVAAVAVLALANTIFDATVPAWQGVPVLLPEAESSQTFREVFGTNFPRMILNPDTQMSPFGDTPRNHFVLLTLGLFVLRWRGAYGWSYVLLFALSLVHQSQTGLLAAYLVGVDALLRPQVFRSVAGPLAALTVAIYLARETLGDVVGVTRPAVLVLVIGAATAVLAALWLGLRRRTAAPLPSTLAGPRDRLLSYGPAASDLILIAAFWLVTFPVAAAINSLGSNNQSVYFWTQLHGRSLGLMRPPVVLGLALLVLDRLGRRVARPRLEMAAVALAAAALIPSGLLAATYPRDPLARLEAALRAIDVSVGPDVDWTTIGERGEDQIYYAVARTLDRGASPP